MDYSPIIEKNRTRLNELEELMGRPDFYDDNKRAGGWLREHRSLQKLTKSWDKYVQVEKQIVDNEDLM